MKIKMGPWAIGRAVSMEVGLNAVRLPFGYWVVTGPSGGDPYEGPCLEVLDEGVRLAGEAGLQVGMPDPDQEVNKNGRVS